MPKDARFGFFLEVLGTTTVALGSTSTIVPEGTVAKSFDLVGNALQALGSAYVSEVEKLGLLKTASSIASAGNLINLSALISNTTETEQALLIMKGDLFQATGVALNLALTSKEENPLIRSANFLQFIGNCLEALAEIGVLQNKDNLKELNAVGSWLQAIGTFISFLILLEESEGV